MNRHESERSVGTLIRLAGERDVPSAAGTRRAHQAAEETWRRMLAQEQAASVTRRRWLAPLGIALAAGTAAIALSLWQAAPAPAELVARVASLEGAAILRSADAQRPLVPGDALAAGTTVIATQGRVALSLGGATSLRLDRGAQLRIEGRERVSLPQGTLYVDSGGINVASALSIGTPAGEVRHVGTQFLVTVSRDATRVRVREGRVQLSARAGAALDLASGDEIEYRDGEVRWRHGLASFGPEWEWAAQVAPMFDAENRPLSEFLDWLVREQGWQLRYASEELQARAREIRLHGSFERLDAVATLDRLVMVTGVPLAVHDGILWVGTRQ
jgi:ferric-dicitrate binding protein FerR (iron transport regulator)